MRKPFALANWKMAMTLAESEDFVARFLAAAGDVLARVEVTLFPPCTALTTVVRALHDAPVGVGAQNVSVYDDAPHTGQISAALLADAGCQWVMLGHWEVRRQLGDDDALVNRKVHRALAAGLRPVLFVGEAAGREEHATADLEHELPVLLAGCRAEQVGRMVFLYEPERAIGVSRPVSFAHVAGGCRTIRSWLRRHLGDEAAEAARTIYGGSVSPQYAAELLQAPDVDGLGATRSGRDPQAWAAIVRLIAEIRG